MQNIRPTQLLGLMLLVCNVTVLADKPSSFRSTKRVAAKVYSENQITFYCGCEYIAKVKSGKTSKRLTPIWESVRVNR